MGSQWSTASAPETDPELEASILLDATELKRKEDKTATYRFPSQRPIGGIAYGVPKYAAEMEFQKPVRIPGWGYGYVTHTFRGLPLNYDDCATANWQKPNTQDNATYFIVKMSWPTKEQYWVKALDARLIQKTQMVVSVEPPGVPEETFLKDLFALPVDTKITNILGDQVLMKDLQPGDQAAINLTYALRLAYK